jgi:NAD-dependent dihydropyrimidine dehydrogenase PreA subunit
MAILKIDGCIGCGICIAACPADVIHLSTKTNKAFIKYPEDCQNCHLCWMYCPVDAIKCSGSVDSCDRFMGGEILESGSNVPMFLLKATS